MAIQLGATETQKSNVTYVNLRVGKISENNKEQKPGYIPLKTTNKDGTVNHFFGKEYDAIAGYITEINWRTRTLENGTRINGWDIKIDTTEKVFVLNVGDKDRPFHRLMSVLCSVNFNEPVKFVGFLGGDKKQDKVLLLYQDWYEEGKKPLQPKYPEKWLSAVVKQKLNEKIELTEKERERVMYKPDGKPDASYPYIREKTNGGWSFEAWEEFLHEKMQDVLKAVENANYVRQQSAESYAAHGGTDSSSDDYVKDDFSEPVDVPNYDDDGSILF